jgi:hypothetical protein
LIRTLERERERIKVIDYKKNKFFNF